MPSAASSSSSDEEESSPVRSPPARRPRLRKGGNIKPVRPSRKTSTPGCTNYDMTCLERLIRTHSIWFQPRVNRDEVEELLAGKESGVNSKNTSICIHNTFRRETSWESFSQRENCFLYMIDELSCTCFAYTVHPSGVLSRFLKYLSLESVLFKEAVSNGIIFFNVFRPSL